MANVDDGQVDGLLDDAPVEPTATSRTSVIIKSPLSWSIVLAVLAWPLAPSALYPCPGLDCSWQGTLQRAAVLRMPYGTHVVFTYGPLGFLTTPELFEPVPAILAFCFILSVSVGIFYLLMRGLRPFMPLWCAVAAAYVIGAAAVLTSAVNDNVFHIWLPVRPQFLLVFCLAIGVAMVIHSDEARRVPAIGLGALGSLMVLILPGLAAGLIAIVVIVVVAAPAHARLATVRDLLLGGIVVGAVGWFATGNGFTNIAPFVSNSLSIVTGYSGAMGLFSVSGKVLTLTVIDVAVLVALALMVGRGTRWSVRIGLLGMTATVVTILCKESYVRPDSAHELVFLASAPVVAVCLTGVIRVRWSGIGAVAVTTAAVIIGAGTFPPLDGSGPVTAVHQFTSEAADLAVPSTRQAMAASLRGVMAYEYAVPPSMLTAMASRCVDVSPNEQNLTWTYPGISFCPLPVPQDYAAYTTQLDQLDTSYLQSSSAPQQILRQAGPAAPTLLPPPAVWSPPLAQLTMECRYTQILASPTWQLTSRVPNRCGPPTLISHVVTHQGDMVHVPPAMPGEAILATFSLTTPALWKLEDLPFRQPQLYATVTGHAGQRQYFQFLTALQHDLHVMRPASTLGYATAFTPTDIDTIIVSEGGSSPWRGRMEINFYRVAMG